MDRISFVLMIVLAMTASTITAAELNEHCSHPLICENKPPQYDNYIKPMEKLYIKHLEFIKKTLVEDLDNFHQPYPYGDDQNCWAETAVKVPYALKSNISSHFVIQLPHLNFVQKIKYTTCQNQGASCFGDVFGAGQSDVDAKCVEKLTAVSVYVFDPAHNKMTFKMFDVPIACACKFQRNA